MSVSYIPQSGTITALEDTIDYAALFVIIEGAMSKPVDLLETVAQTIITATHQKFPQITEAEIEIEKLNPPIDRFNGSAAVKLLRQFEK
jgi:dihydroneopterin aldolase